jgi:four helix bundle protein
MEDWRWELGVHNAMTFEDLDCWKTARLLVNHIYSMTRKGDLSKDFGLSGQIQRAGVSVMTNVAEGFERVHVPEKLQFYNVARGSSAEVRSLLYVVEDNYPTVAAEAVRLRDDVVTVGKLVSGLIRSTETRRSKIRIVVMSIFHLLSS